MASGVGPSTYVTTEERHTAQDDDAALLRLCAAFIVSAQARSIEGARLDNMAWTAAVDGGYDKLCRSAPSHRGQLAEILSSAPSTIAGLVAKAHAVRVHWQDPESEPTSYVVLANDIIGMFERVVADRRSSRQGAAQEMSSVASALRHVLPRSDAVGVGRSFPREEAAV